MHDKKRVATQMYDNSIISINPERMASKKYTCEILPSDSIRCYPAHISRFCNEFRFYLNSSYIVFSKSNGVLFGVKIGVQHFL